MSNNTPADRKYTKSHEWAHVMVDGSLTVGISHHAQDLLGDMVFVEVPEVGRKVAAGEACAVVESVKAASDVYSPVAGEVVEVNEQLAGAPELTNKDPYGDGWLFRLQPNNVDDLKGLMDAEGYDAMVAAEEH